LGNLTILKGHGHRAALYVSQFPMEDVFGISQLAEPASSQKVLSRHVGRTSFILVNSNLLISKLKFVAVAWLIAQSSKTLNHVINWSEPQ